MPTSSSAKTFRKLSPSLVHHASSLLLRSLAVFFLLAASCTAGTQPKFDTVTVNIKGKPFTLEVADSPAKHELGLMNRDAMPAAKGMLFVFDTPDKYSFWMKNTRIPLDIIYLDTTAKVIAIHHRLPYDENGMAPDSPALFVIELNAGTAKAIGLKDGDLIPLPDKYLKTTPPSTEK